MFNFFEVLSEMLSYPFLTRAIIVGSLVSLCASLLGVSLVLKRYSMIGDGLSHVGFGALALAVACNAAPLAVSIPVVLVAAFILLRISENSKIKGDAAIALISSGALAFGVIVVSLTTGLNTDVDNFMFGSILSLSQLDANLSIALSIVVLVLFVGFYPRIFAITFDENFAKAIGTRVGVYNLMLAFLTAITIVLGMRMMGALLISSLIIFPPLTAMRLFKKFKSVIISSAVISLVCFFCGMVISYVWETPSGASIVMVNIIAFLLFSLIGKIKGNLIQSGKMPKALARLFMMLSIVALFSLTLTGCKNAQSGQVLAQQIANEQPADEDIINIEENAYVSWVNEIYTNTDLYIGKTVKIEGMLSKYYDETADATYYCVYREGPGCCDTDGSMCGFEFCYDGQDAENLESDQWVEVVGTLEYYQENDNQYLQIQAQSVTVKQERGLEVVTM